MLGRAPVKIYLHGPLAERFGVEHEFCVSRPSEAVQALDANYPGFLAEFVKHESYSIFADGDWRGGDMIEFPVSREIHFCPIIEGRAFIGAALVTALIPSISATTATLIGGVLMAGLFLGISFLLTPKAPKLKDAGKDENYAFSGPENVTAQGAAVPLIYGRVYAGTVVASAGLELDVEYTAGPSATFVNMEGRTLRAVAAPLEPYPPPTGGFPEIVNTAAGRGPYGWQPAVQQIIIGKTRRDRTKQAYVFIRPTPDQNGRIWAWTESKGFYSFTSGAMLEPSEYVPATEQGQ